jgi:hypothetical protein
VKGFCVFDEKSGSFLCMDRLVVRERGWQFVFVSCG